MLNPTDRDILKFAVMWLPYGGGDEEDIMVAFGLDRYQYLDRVNEIVTAYPQLLPSATAARLRSMFLVAQRRQTQTAHVELPDVPSREPQ